MSYLHTPRLIFSGDFLADVSTVNNDPAHYDNEIFAPNFQEPRVGKEKKNMNGWWNPEGGSVFNFQNCTVQQYELSDGTVVSEGDELIGQLIRGADGRTTGKMVDLDPQQQMCSELWAVQLRILTKAGHLLVEGDLEAVGFRDLQVRQFSETDLANFETIKDGLLGKSRSIPKLFSAAMSKSEVDGIDALSTSAISLQQKEAANPPYTQNGQSRGAPWTTVLKNIKWGRKASSHPFFKALKEKTHDNKLAVNLTGFGYYYAHNDGRFSFGKILGAIGPWFRNEPLTFAPARRLFGTFSYKNSGNRLVNFFQYSNCLFEPAQRRLTVDVGGSFPIANAIGKITLDQSFYLAVSHKTVNWGASIYGYKILEEDYTIIGEIPYEKGDNWLLDTGGIVTFNQLSEEVMGKLPNHQLLLLTKGEDGNYYGIGREAKNGYLLRPDNFVQRIDYLQNKYVYVYAYQWGQPIESKIKVNLEPQQDAYTDSIYPNGVETKCQIPAMGTPQDGLTFEETITTNENGRAILKVTGNKIEYPRVYIDGQIYYLTFEQENSLDDSLEYTNQVNIHLRSYYEAPENPTWDDIKETLQQYSNLYPIMSKFLVDLGDPEGMKKAREIMIFAFSQPIEDSMHMPVTRDLSESKRTAILRWLEGQPPSVPHGERTIFDRTQGSSDD